MKLWPLIPICAAAVALVSVAHVPNAPTDLITGTCADHPIPDYGSYKIFDPDAPKYEPAEESNEWVEIRPDGVEYKFVNQGQEFTHECPGDPTRYFFTRQKIVSSPFPKCWKTIEEDVSDCKEIPPDPTIDTSPVNVDPGFDEHSPDGPGEGPPGAPTVDHPAP